MPRYNLLKRCLYSQDNDKENVPLTADGKRAFKENYGWTMIWGGMYAGSISFCIMHVISTGLYGCLCLYTSYLTVGDLNLMSEAAHFTVFFESTMLGAVNALFNRKKINCLFNAIGEGFYKYEQTMDPKTSQLILARKKTWTEEKYFFARLFNTYIYIIHIYIGIVRHFSNYYSRGHDQLQPDDGIDRQLSVAVWLPFETKSIAGHLLAVITQYIIAVMTCGTVLGMDTVYLCICSEICNELRIVSLGLRHLDERAKYVYKNLYGLEPVNLHVNKKFHRCVKKCLGESVAHHIRVNELFQVLNSWQYFLLLCMMTGGTFMLCLSGVLFSSDTVSVGGKLSSALFLSGELVHTFLYCWYGEQISELSTQIGDQLYKSEWPSYSSVVKPYLIVIQCKCQMPLELSAGGFMNAGLNTYSNVLSSAYSYFNLIRAVNT